jgi:hypothetical protein
MAEHRELTMKEKAFVREVTRIDADRPSTASEAYRRSYDTQGSNRTVSVEASKLMAKPHIRAAVEIEEARIEADRRRSSRGSAAAIQRALWEEYSVAEKSSDRINALKVLKDMLPKNAGNELEDNVSSKQELVTRLMEIMEDVADGAVEVIPSDVVEKLNPTQDDDDLALDIEVLDVQSELADREPDF